MRFRYAIKYITTTKIYKKRNNRTGIGDILFLFSVIFVGCLNMDDVN